MACNCESYECLEVGINPCNAGTSLGIQAATTGNYDIWLEFNGSVREFSVAATEGEDISVPTSVFNEQYTHEMRVTDPEGERVCYKVRTYPSSIVSGFEPVPPASDTWQWATLDVDGLAIESDLFAGEVSPIIWANGQPMEWETQGVIHEGDTMDFTSVGGISGTLIFQYKNG